jgi:hypothetical protein
LSALIEQLGQFHGSGIFWLGWLLPAVMHARAGMMRSNQQYAATSNAFQSLTSLARNL